MHERALTSHQVQVLEEGLGKSQPGADSNQTQAPATAALLSPLIDFYWGRSPPV